jgi:hypothetical protein
VQFTLASIKVSPQKLLLPDRPLSSLSSPTVVTFVSGSASLPTASSNSTIVVALSKSSLSMFSSVPSTIVVALKSSLSMISSVPSVSGGTTSSGVGAGVLTSLASQGLVKKARNRIEEKQS